MIVSSAHRGHHMASGHADEDLLSSPAGWPEPRAGLYPASAVASDEDIDGDDDNGVGDEGRRSTPPDGSAAVAVSLHSDSDGEEEPRAAGNDCAGPRRQDGIERGSLAEAAMPIPGGTGSISARIAAYSARFPEAESAEPCFNVENADRSTILDMQGLQDLLWSIVTCGGSGLSQVDKIALGRVLLRL